MWHMGWGWGHAIFGTLTMLAFWGGLVVLVVFLVRWLGGGTFPRQEPPPPRRTPLEVLQERFAKGEIDKPEYEEKRRLLKE
jgi:putative membrane protein